MDKSTIKAIITMNGYRIISEARAGNNYGDVLKLDNGCIINCFDKGTYNCQGKNTTEVKGLLERAASDFAEQNRKVFVVYGHDQVARTQLEAMLRRWDLEPLIIDQLASSGNTIIEKLEEYIPQANFGIVLATPDDIGYPKGHEDLKKYRVRQNVVLEWGCYWPVWGDQKSPYCLRTQKIWKSPQIFMA